jgi:large subunit ribosomal protein L9
MQVVLLERVEKLGQIGDVVKVKDGFARNYLLPKKKALRATKANLGYFETQRAQLEARNLEQRKEAEKIGEKLKSKAFVLLRQAGDRGQLYGSVSPRDIASVVTAGGFRLSARKFPSTRPSRASVCMRSLSCCILRSACRSPSMSRVRKMKPSARHAARMC